MEHHAGSLTRHAWHPDTGNRDGTFTQVATTAGVADTDSPGRPTDGGGVRRAEFLDYDLDGDLDLYTNTGRYGSNNFFENNGDGTFTDITDATGLANLDDTHDIAIADFNGDGFPDVYEINFTGSGSSANKLFLNTVPEPATLMILALSCMVLVHRRHVA